MPSSIFSDNNNFCSGLVVNNYILIEKLGDGTFSQVWLCVHKVSGTMYAIKIQDLDCDDCAETEIKHYSKINSVKKTLNPDTCINKFHEYFTYTNLNEEETYYCLIFSLAACNLYDIIRYCKYNSTNLFNINTIKKIIRQLLSAIIVCDELNIVHTDIKPENLLVQGLNHRTKKIKQLFKITDLEKSFQNMKRLVHKKNKNKKYVDYDNLYQKAATEYVNKILNCPELKILEQTSGESESLEESETKSLGHIDSNITYDSYEQSSQESDTSDTTEHCELPIDTNFINSENFTVKLTDFGSAQDFGHIERVVQTRHYRAPEVILRCKYNNKCDIWSVGCILFELLTSSTLFDPVKDEMYSTNKKHLTSIIELCGPFPKSVVLQSMNKKYYFNNDFTLKIYHPIKKNSIEKLLNDNISYNMLEITDKEYMLDFLNKCFDCDFNSRMSALDLINHKWLLVSA